MNKTIKTIAFCILALIGVCSWIWWGGLNKLFAGQVACGFSRTLAQYVKQHDGRMPSDWSEFENWQIREYGFAKYPAESSTSKVEILRSPIIATNEPPRFIRVLDPRLKNMEHFMNWELYDAWSKAAKTNHNAQQCDSSNTHSPSAQGADGR